MGSGRLSNSATEVAQLPSNSRGSTVPLQSGGGWNDARVPLSIFLRAPTEESSQSFGSQSGPADAAIVDLISRTTSDAAFRATFVRDPQKALADVGITVSADVAQEMAELLARVGGAQNRASSASPRDGGDSRVVQRLLGPEMRTGYGEASGEQADSAVTKGGSP